MATKSIKATDRELKDWFLKINSGEIKLPRFQRFEAWDRRRISSLLSVTVNNLPLGITLILNVGEKPQFVDRYLETAPSTNGRVTEHLLDGQQRLSALWRIMHNNYDWETYYVYIPDYDNYEDSIQFDEITGYCQPRWLNKSRKFPLWADTPRECLRRGLIPSNLLMPGEISGEIDKWIEEALSDELPDDDVTEETFKLLKIYYKKKDELKSRIVNLREIVAHYNLPFLALPSSTEKEIALTVFINMNTNSKPLSLYDIIVAEVEGAEGESLHDLENDLDVKYPNIKHYFNLSDLILSTSALLQDKLPNQRGMIDMDKSLMIDNWELLIVGLKNMAIFLETQGIFDYKRLPTNAVLAVLAALFTVIPESGDSRGVAEIMLKKYLWSAFFTDRYENSTASRAFADYRALKNVLQGKLKDDDKKYQESDVPIFTDEYPVATVEQLKTIGWPKGENVRGRAILAVTTYLGAYDFADGQKASREHLVNREYHHIYPDALLKEAEIESLLALNCALITNTTNRQIGRKDPLKYLEERYEWTSENHINQRLNSHLIPVEELANGGYENISDTDRIEKIRKDFDNFITKRAQIINIAASDLCNGKTISIDEIIKKAASLSS